jgi:D-ribose pyranose/furanose isomerase RbsD
MNDLQFYLAVGLPIALNLSAITISFLALNKRIDDMRDVLRAETKAEVAVLRSEVRADIADLRGELRIGLLRMEGKIDSLLNMMANHEQRVSRLEEKK